MQFRKKTGYLHFSVRLTKAANLLGCFFTYSVTVYCRFGLWYPYLV